MRRGESNGCWHIDNRKAVSDSNNSLLLLLIGCGGGGGENQRKATKHNTTQSLCK
jgi:hypothetical protein